MKATRILLSFFLGFILVPSASHALVSSNGMGGGAWSAGPSWDVGVPICGDSIHIQAGDVMHLAAHQDYSACGSPMVLTIDGTLFFPGNGPKLKLPAGSTIIVNVGGLITASGGGNDNKISIGPEWVWEQMDGDVPGYACFGACTAPLPVQFLNVEALAKERSVCIRWTTYTESNNDFFTVERSSDGITFIDIVEVDGAGTSNSILNYLVKDLEPLNGLSFYRVRQNDFDGDFEYSKIVSVEVNFGNEQNVSIYPNPLSQSEDLQVYLEGMLARQDVRVELRNIRGELGHVEDYIILEEGAATLTVSTNGRLKPGLSFISILVDGELQSFQIMIR